MSTATVSAPQYMHTNESRVEVVTFADALTRLGLLGRVFGVGERELATMVAFTPSAHANADGRLWHFCSGPVLYSFCVVRKSPAGNWWTGVSRSYYIAVTDDGGGQRLELVSPA